MMDDAELKLIDALWRASNDRSVGQTGLLDNPLPRKPLTRARIKPRLVGHWGTTPEHGLDATEIDDALNRRSGLLGISGVSADMREARAAADAGNEHARIAIEVYCHRVRQAIGALAVTLGGIDALVLTAGVGENSPDIRAMTCRDLECLGIELDPNANIRCRADADVAGPKSRARVFVLSTREDLAMLDEVVQVVSAQRGAA